MCERKFRPIKYTCHYSYTNFGMFILGHPVFSLAVAVLSWVEVFIIAINWPFVPINYWSIIDRCIEWINERYYNVAAEKLYCDNMYVYTSAGARTGAQGRPWQVLWGHQDMASVGAWAYNGGLGAEPPAKVQGQSPWSEVWGALPLRSWKPFWFWTSHRAVFLQCSLGFLQINVCHSPRFKLPGNQQKIGVGEGNEQGQGRDRMWIVEWRL